MFFLGCVQDRIGTAPSLCEHISHNTVVFNPQHVRFPELRSLLKSIIVTVVKSSIYLSSSVLNGLTDTLQRRKSLNEAQDKPFFSLPYLPGFRNFLRLEL